MDHGSPEQDDYGPEGKQKRKSAKGRKLIRWNPDLDQLVLLHVDYVCTLQGIAIPWDEIGRMIAPHLTGEAIKQHLVKIIKFREDDGHPVPPKLDRSQRRKAFAATSAATTPTPARVRGKKAGARADIDDQLQETPVKPGRSLLYKKPEPKSKRTPKKDASTPKTPASGPGRKPVQPQKNAVVVKDEDESDGEFSLQNIKSVARGAKRNRKPKKVESSDDEAIDETPTKKPKMTDNYFRARSDVDYTKQLAQDEDDEDGDDSIALKSEVKEKHSSQASSNDYSAPAPQNSLGTPALTESYQSYPQIATPSYDYGNQATPFNSSPADHEYGVHGIHDFNTHVPPPMMQLPMSHGNGFNPSFNSMMPIPANFGFGGGAPLYGHAVNALSNFAHGQGGAFPAHFGNSVAHGTGDDVYAHGNGVVSKIDTEDHNEGQDNIIVDGMLDGAAGDSYEYPATGSAYSLPHDAGGGLHLNTGYGTSLPDSITVSPIGLVDGETGITPALAQAGFTVRPPLHTDSFDSGYDNTYDAKAVEHKTPGDDFFALGDDYDDDFLAMGGGHHGL